MPLFDLSALFTEDQAAPRSEKSTSAVGRFETMHSEKVHSLKQLTGRIPERNALNEQYVFLNDERIFQFYNDCIRHRAD